MGELKRTVLFERHVALGAKIVEFGGYEMPVFYPDGILKEHLTTRKGAGLFDVSHMGRFIVGGENALDFLQHVLTNNAQSLDKPETGAQYTFISNETGGAVDDSYLYRFTEDEYMLVVNAANRLKDWEHFQAQLSDFNGVALTDRSDETAMIALQGPASRAILNELIESGRLPEPARNAVSTAKMNGSAVRIARTGYTGEPLGFELFIENEAAPQLWDKLVAKGASPTGLGARDTLRLEAGLPLYGHELGCDPEGKEIPIFACPLAKFSVSFSDLKKNFIGRKELARQHEAFKKIMYRDFSSIQDLPRMIYPLAIAGRGIARQGDKVAKEGRHVGYVTSGTMIPFWEFEGTELSSKPADHNQKRSICLAYLDSDILEDEELTVNIRSKQVNAVVAPYHMRSESPPYARPILFDHSKVLRQFKSEARKYKAIGLLRKAIANTHWRQKECINLIPSEMTVSPVVRLLSVMDPSFRYAEHKKLKAFYEAEIFYYQGTDFIDEVEALLVKELKKFLGCAEVETRMISGQMANAAIFSAMVDYINRADRKCEPRRLRKVMNNHIGKGGHLSSQPMGALRDFVARDPSTERPAVVNFPVLEENLYKIDVPETLKLIDEHRPELIIFGKSMVITKEPVREVRQFLDDQGIDSVLMYDMAHVLGLIGPHFQEPFLEGADLVSGSTHKTYFGTQRGVVGSRYLESEERYALWEAIERRTFPGSVSNHHLGTMVGLLMAAYEMNEFKDDYQAKVISNAKGFARALKDCGLQVAGDPAVDFTETHQVIVEVEYAKGPEIARRLEDNNIVCNYQAGPEDESFSASGALRMGVSEMTRFGMEAADFEKLAQYMFDVIVHHKIVKEEIIRLRSRFLEMKYCFRGNDFDNSLHKMMACIDRSLKK
jgi:aminomethyltransferase